ncbi:hypothetical protein CMI37_10385 [Candidatus Pacearchaeota archaeon]|nr:hypothetical protein [Candidatus Pacearchaeota archaeon]|tara:strand:+ start:5075 stop:5512 length:438 start_codon:yes stop_codon:yes gene_type:complete
MAKKKKASNKGRSKKSAGKLGGNLTIHFMPYSEIAHIDSLERIKKILGIVLQNKIIILQGKLTLEEETRLIENTMTLIGNIKGFQGVEIATISGENEHGNLFNKVRHNIARILVGEQDALTIIGPASVVKEIKRDPKKMEMMLRK